MNRTRIFYPVLGLGVGPTPSTGFHYSSGNSGVTLIKPLQRIQSVGDSFSLNRQDVLQLGQLGLVSRELISQPQVPLNASYIVADAYNEAVIGLYVSGDQGALRYILDQSQNNKNYFIPIAPVGVDTIGWTGQSQVIQINNGYLDSYSTEGAVGGLPTANFSVRALNYSTSTGSINQTLNAINPTFGTTVAGLLYSLPVFTSGVVGSVSALRPGDIQVVIATGAGLGLNVNDLKVQRYNIGFNLNLQDLLQLGTRYAYSIEPRFPVDLTCSITCIYGDLTTGSLNNLFCADTPVTLYVNLYQPGCGGYGPLAVQYKMVGMQLDSYTFSNQDVSSVAAEVALNFSTKIGGPTDQIHNLYISGISGLY